MAMVNVRSACRRGLGTVTTVSLLAALLVAVAVGVAPPRADAAGGSTVTFAYTGASQSWTVPAGITSIRVDAQGAQGDG